MAEANGLQIVRRIDAELDYRGETRVNLAKYLGIKPQNISAWYTRGTVPAGDICLKIAKYLGVSVEYVVYGEEPSSTKEERWLFSQWKKLTDEQKNNIKLLLNGWEEARTKEEKNNTSQA